MIAWFNTSQRKVPALYQLFNIYFQCKKLIINLKKNKKKKETNNNYHTSRSFL
ncbi:unnamed protein product, partial [Arabidopsis halleri]